MGCKCKEDGSLMVGPDQEPKDLKELLDSWIKEGCEHDEKHWAELKQRLVCGGVQTLVRKLYLDC